MHSRQKSQTCHYFRNNIFCPFEELGCKFLHPNRIIDNTEDKLSERKMILTIQDILKAILKSSNSVLLLLKKTGSYRFDEKKDKKNFNCENCPKKSQCDECYVDEYIQKKKYNKTCRICKLEIRSLVKQKKFKCGISVL